MTETNSNSSTIPEASTSTSADQAGPKAAAGVKTTRESTPLMQQYHALKAKHPGELLFFRLGDFYELFDDDARQAAPLLEVALTHRQQIPMCGVPAHALDPYIAKLLKSGRRVAIAEQMSDPATTKGLVKRDVVRVITPGTLQEDSLLPSRRCNFLTAISFSTNAIGLASIECSTGEFIATEFSGAQATAQAWDEISRLGPSEIMAEPLDPEPGLIQRLRRQGLSIVTGASIDFSAPMAEERLKAIHQTATLRGFGLEEKPMALRAAGAALRYFEKTQCGRPFTLWPIRTYSLVDHLQIDANTLEHLDLIGTPKSLGSPSKTLLDVLDETKTPMGARLLRRWVSAPLRRVPPILSRQEKVEFFVENREARRRLREALGGWPDSERILTRLHAGSLMPRDLSHLAQGLARMPELEAVLKECWTQSTALGATFSESLTGFLQNIPQDAELAALLSSALVDSPPPTLKEGGVIRDGYNPELDEVRSWITDGKNRLLELEKKERESTGIPTLKIGFNNIFGYYLECTKTHIAKIPPNYIRKQTTANGERYITPELKEFESRILGAEERVIRLETSIIQSLREAVLQKSEKIRSMGAAVSELDVFSGLAEIADRHHYVKPVVDDSDVIAIRDGRHPVLEAVLPAGTLVANDVSLDAGENKIWLLTGPNMSGKSTYLRQNALLVVMAQIGSYVPAGSARIGVIDQLFTRIGASDRLMEGESTFMVEMIETARILNHATPKSLVILDEVGRGTSTYDGISIAWACVEYLHARGPKVLFATHYFELTRLPETMPGVQNAHVSAREWGDEVIFLHKVEPGPADRSYGIHVARLAGIPRPVLERATSLLQGFEKGTMKPASENQKPQQGEFLL